MVINTVWKAVISQTCYGRRNIDGLEEITIVKAFISQTCYTIHHTFISNTLWNRDFCCRAIIFCKFCSFCLCVQFVLESITGAVFNDVGGLNATRFNCQNCAEATPRWCSLVGIQWGFGNIESSFVDWGIGKDVIITYRGRYFTCHSFERITVCVFRSDWLPIICI